MTVTNNRKKDFGNKREQILLAAVEMFLEKDFYQVTITEIAERAEVGKGTVYEYFSSKEGLFKESFSYCADSYLQSFSKHLFETTSVKQTLQDIVNTHLELLKDNRNKLHLLFNERPLSFQELQAWVIDRRQELLEGITNLFRKGIDAKEIRSDIDIEMAGRLFLALNCVVMGGMVVLDNIDLEEEQLSKLLDIFWNGIGNLQVRGDRFPVSAE